MRLPIRTRLTLVFAVLTALVLGATGVFLYLRFGSDLLRNVDAALRLRADTLLAALDRPGFHLADEDRIVDPDEAFVQIIGPGGDVLDSSSVLAQTLLSPRERRRLGSGRYLGVDVALPDETVEARLFAVRAGEGRALVVGTSLEERTEALARLAKLMWVGAPAALGLTTLIAWLLAGSALRPVERMRAEAAAISASQRGRRLPVPETGDEIARLGETLNSMLERMETALERQRRFVDDASHELRTPLGILKAELELALKRARTPEELSAALRSAAEESDRVNRLAEDLLVLARTDRSALPVNPIEVDLGALVADVVRSFESSALAQDIDIERRIPPELRARVDPTRIRQAISNLLDNALRHTPSQGTVEISGIRDDDWVSITVIDSGEGFPPAFIDKAFEPFARADSARTRSDGGAGLGLAIVRAIAEAHGGTAVATNQESGGAGVALRLRT